MKIHYEESALFSDLSQDTKSKFPNLELCPLKSKTAAASKNCIFVEETLEPDQLITEIKGQNLQYVLQKNKGRFENDVLATGQLFENAAAYFHPEFSYSPDPVLRSQRVAFRAPLDKEQLKMDTAAFVAHIGSPSVSQSADAVIEELYMNAMLDAPHEAQKRGISANPSTAEFFLCQTEKCLQVSCTDFYGSLEIQKFLSRMKEVYERGAGDVINMNTGGGAGLGCVILFEHSSALILGVLPGRQTKVTSLISLGVSNRQRTQMKKSLLWFEL